MESRTIGADEVAEALDMSRAYACKLIRRLNKEMEERGVHHRARAGQPHALREVPVRGRGGFRCR